MSPVPIHVKISKIFVLWSAPFITHYPTFGRFPTKLFHQQSEGSEPLFSSCISSSRLSIDGSKPAVQKDILYPTGPPKQSSRCSQNKTQYRGTKAGPQFSLQPLGSINEPSYLCVQWSEPHQQDQQ